MSQIRTATEFVRHVLEKICENTGAISVDQIEDERGFLITVRVAEEDMGKIIGKQGQMISSLRTLVKVIGARENERINLKIGEDYA